MPGIWDTIKAGLFGETFACPGCGRAIQIRGASEGQLVQCKTCGQKSMLMHETDQLKAIPLGKPEEKPEAPLSLIGGGWDPTQGKTIKTEFEGIRLV